MPLEQLCRVILKRYAESNEILFFFFFSWPCHVECRILVPGLRIKPMPPALGVQSLNHWTTREVLKCNLTYGQSLGEARPAGLSEEGAAFTQCWTRWDPESNYLISKRSQELHNVPRITVGATLLFSFMVQNCSCLTFQL